MAHLTEGTLRAYVDGELGAEARATAERHLTGCEGCRVALAAVADDAGWAAAALDAPWRAAGGPAAGLGAAWRRVAVMAAGRAEPITGGAAEAHASAHDGAAAAASGAPGIDARARRGGGGDDPQATAAARASAGRWRPHPRLLGGVAAAAVIAASLAVPQVRAAAGDFLQIFRPQQFQVVTLSPTDVQAIQHALATAQGGSVDISGIATVRVTPPDVRPVAIQPAGASAAAGFPVMVPTPAPAGYTLASSTLTQERTVRFQLHAAGINALLASLGSSDRVPASLDGRIVTLVQPATVALHYQAPGRGGVTVLQTQTPELEVPSGVDVAGLRQTLLGLPFLPADVRQQLAAIQDWQHTAVIPGIAGVSTPVSVGAAQGVFVQSPAADGPSALAWFDGSVVRAVVGPVTQAEAQAVAASMR